jgi:hypothetical protein
MESGADELTRFTLDVGLDAPDLDRVLIRERVRRARVAIVRKTQTTPEFA